VDSKLTAREVAIIVVLVLVGIWLMGSRADGPVEKAQREIEARGGHMPGHEHAQAPESQPEGHPEGQVQPSDGNPLITLGQYQIGDQWFNHAVDLTMQDYISQGLDEHAARDTATSEVLELALKELIILKYIDELSVIPDEKEIHKLRDGFFDSFKTDEERQTFLDRMGMSMDDMENSWKNEAEMISLQSKVFETEGFNPDPDDAETVFQDWLLDKVNTEGFEFIDESLQSLYEQSIDNGWTVM